MEHETKRLSFIEYLRIIEDKKHAKQSKETEKIKKTNYDTFYMSRKDV